MFKEGGYFGHSKEMASDSDSFLRKTKENVINNTDYDDTNLRLWTLPVPITNKG